MTIEDIVNSVPDDNSWGVWLHQYWVRSQHETGLPGALAGDMTHEALPSWYAGITFRSKLEADWAATLDTHGVRWEYEPETITLPSGAKYIPDFRLPDIGCWLEVKGTGVPRIEKAVEFGEMLACDCDQPLRCTCRWTGGQLVIIGHPPQPYSPWKDPEFADRPWAAARVRSWRHEGHPRWSLSSGRTCWFTICPDCRAGGWITTGQCRACRGPLAGGRAYSSGEFGLSFTNSECRVAPIRTVDDEETETP
ncbi:hypothetical protein ACWCRD_02650 [Streptomyces sp. NPDC002092]